jgi:methyltransferase family protein
MRVTRHVGNRDILTTVLAGVVERALRDPRTFRQQLVKDIFVAAKRFGAPHVRSIEVADIAGIEDVLICGGVTRKACGPQYDAFVAAALCRLWHCRSVFEIGTFQGETAWLIAHNNPDVLVYTLDLPGLGAARHAALEVTDPNYFDGWDRGARFRGTPEAARIVQLYGDSATFDYSPYRQRIDLVYIDASHSYSYVRSDTAAALNMLSERGSIIWDDYTYYPGIFAYLNELSPALQGGIVHLLGTRLAMYTRQPINAAAPLDLRTPHTSLVTGRSSS